MAKKRGIAETEEIIRRMNAVKNLGPVYADIYENRKKTGKEEEYKTGIPAYKATQNYADYLSNSVSFFRSVLPKKMPDDVKDKYIANLLQKEVADINKQVIDEGVKIIYSLDTDRGLKDANFKVEFMYPDSRKIK